MVWPSAAECRWSFSRHTDNLGFSEDKVVELVPMPGTPDFSDHFLCSGLGIWREPPSGGIAVEIDVDSELCVLVSVINVTAVLYPEFLRFGRVRQIYSLEITY